MGLRINTNVEAFNAHRTLSGTSNKIAKSMERLSSGFRINRAGDDAAGLGISERMRSQIRGLAQAQRNAQDGLSFAATADGALGEITSMLQRVRELTVQHLNGSNDAAARTAIETEVLALADEIQRTVDSTQWNGVSILASGPPGTILQVGPNGNPSDQVTINPVNVMATGGAMDTLDLGTVFTGTGTAIAAGTLTAIDNAITEISGFRSEFGAVSNRLEYTINSLGIAQENVMAAESRIRDVDMAAEMTNFTKLQILQQSGTAMLAQANMASQSVLSLLQ